MENSLVKRIERGILKVGAPLLIGGLALINSGCDTSKTYNIGGKLVNYSPSKRSHFDLYLEDNYVYIYNPIISTMAVGFWNYSEHFKLSNETHEDSVVINKAQEKVDYYLNKIDSTDKAERIKTGLEALK